jgi:hypothetical protein
MDITDTDELIRISMRTRKGTLNSSSPSSSSLRNGRFASAGELVECGTASVEGQNAVCALSDSLWKSNAANRPVDADFPLPLRSREEYGLRCTIRGDLKTTPFINWCGIKAALTAIKYVRSNCVESYRIG